MGPKAQTRKKKTKLPEGLEKRLGAYALAAAAAGAGLAGALAMPTPALADIISYTPSSPFQVGGSAHTFQTFSSSGVPLLAFSEHVFINPSYLPIGMGLLAGTANGNPDVMLGPGSLAGGNILKLASGDVIGGSGNFKFYGLLYGKSFGGSASGTWSNGATGFVGLRFLNSISGSVNAYFGWAKLSVSTSSKGGILAKVDQAAIELCPNVSIQAGQTSGGPACAEPGDPKTFVAPEGPTNTPEPGTLSLLAMGAVGLFALRRKKLAGSN